MKTNTPIGRKENLVIQEVENEVLIYDLKSNEAFCLNETSAFIWKLCDGRHTTTKISQELKKKFKTDVDEGLIWLALDQLKKSELIKSEPEVPAEYVGMSRRQVIRKIGLSSMIVLPIVASVISPTGVMAASCVSTLGNCTTNPQCCTMFCVDTAPTPQSNQCCTSATGTNRPAVNVGPVNGGAGDFTCLGGTPATATTSCNTLATMCCSGTATIGACTDQPGITPSTYACNCS